MPLCDRCPTKLIWGLILGVIMTRIAGLIMYAVWFCDCFFREFKVEVECKHFTLYPIPEVVSAIWLALVSITSVLFIIYIIRCQPNYPQFKLIPKYLCQKLYFYKLSVILLLVIVYDMLTIFGHIETLRRIVYSTYMAEHITSVALMFTLNFMPTFVATEWKKKGVYKAMLLVYSLENYVNCTLDTVVAAYKLVSVPACAVQQLEVKFNISESTTSAGASKFGNTVCHDAISVSMLLLLLVSVSLRRTLGEFFLTKIFREDVDILDIPLRPNTPLRNNMANEEEVNSLVIND